MSVFLCKFLRGCYLTLLAIFKVATITAIPKKKYKILCSTCKLVIKSTYRNENIAIQGNVLFCWLYLFSISINWNIYHSVVDLLINFNLTNIESQSTMKTLVSMHSYIYILVEKHVKGKLCWKSCLIFLVYSLSCTPTEF